MATIYNYFHLGEQTLYLDNLTLHPPTLLTFSKIKNGMKGETNLHLHSYLELFYFESGKGFFEIDNKVYPLQADKLLIVDAKKLHLQYSDSRKRPLTYYNFSIDNLHLKNKPANSITSGGFFIYTFPSKQNKIRANIIRLMNEFENKQYNYNNKIYAIFTEILIDTLRLVLHDDDFSEKKFNALKEYAAKYNLKGGFVVLDEDGLDDELYISTSMFHRIKDDRSEYTLLEDYFD